MQTGTHIRLVLGRTAKAIERVDRESIADTGLSSTDFSILEALLHQGPLPINTIGGKVLLTSGSISEDKVGRYAPWLHPLLKDQRCLAGGMPPAV